MSPANHYQFATFFTALVNLTLVGIVFYRGSNQVIIRKFVHYGSAIVFWAIFVLLATTVRDPAASLFFSQLFHAGAALIPVFFLHFTCVYVGRKETTPVVRAFDISTLFFLAVILFFPQLFFSGVSSKFGFPFFPDAGKLYTAWFGFSCVTVFYTHTILIRAALSFEGARKKQALFFTGANLLGYLGGIGCFLPVYGLGFFPFPYGPYGVALFSFVAMCSISRYRFLDIEKLLRNTVIFAGLWGFMSLVMLLGTFGIQKLLDPYSGIQIYWARFAVMFLVVLGFDPARKLLANLTDRFLFRKKHDYHKLLKDASRGMSNIESLERLLGLVIHFVTMKMRVRNAAVLIRDPKSNDFSLAYQRGYDKKFYSLVLNEDDPLIDYIAHHKESVDIERIREKIEDVKYRRKKTEGSVWDYEAIRDRMMYLQTTCCVPSFLGRELKNILLLGEKKSGEYYSTEDLNLLCTLAQESAIAIENARLYDETKRRSLDLEQINEQLERSRGLLERALDEAEGANKQLQDAQAQLIHEQKMATLGRLAASVGHEVNNPLTILSMNVSRAILKYRKDPDVKVAEIADVFDKMEKNVERIKAVVNTLTGLLKKSEKGKFEPLSLKLILEETLPLVQFQTYLDNLSGTEVDFNVPGSIPLIRGDLERLQEVFLNMFINAYHAMAGKRHRKIAVRAEPDAQNPKMVAIYFTDNGGGMTEEVRKKIFNYGFTTKPSGKGSGLGLYMCKYIIELHGGTIAVKSKVGEGTTFTLTLPVYEEAPKVKPVPAARSRSAESAEPAVRRPLDRSAGMEYHTGHEEDSDRG
jgi:signal transduction histidine kinase